MELMLGIGRRDITPEIGGNLMGYRDDVFSESVRDNLHVTAMIFGYGTLKYAMINATVCIVQKQLSIDLRNMISEKTGIPYDNIMLEPTHTHSGPNTYGGYGWGGIDEKYCNEIFIPMIMEAVEEANSSMVEVQMGVSFGKSYLAVNRREPDAHNNICLGQCEWGSFNPRMTVIAFTDMSGKPVLNMIHYGAHGTAAGANVEISRDWPGVMTDAVEKVSGAPTVFCNGPEGDVGPRLSSGCTEGGGDARFIDEIGEIAAKDAVSIYYQINTKKSVDMVCNCAEIKIPLKKRISREEAVAELKKLGNASVNLEGKMADFYKRIVASYDEGYADEEYQTITQCALRIGDIVFVAFPYELFSEIGMRVEKYSKFKNVLPLALTNGIEGGVYFVTQSAIPLGGYEVGCALAGNVQNYTDDADYALIKETLKNIETL